MHGGHTTCMAGPIRNMREPPHPHRLIRILSSACSLILSSALIIIRSGYHIRSQAQVAGSATALSYSNSYDTTEQLQLSSLRVRVVYPTYTTVQFSVFILQYCILRTVALLYYCILNEILGFYVFTVIRIILILYSTVSSSSRKR